MTITVAAYIFLSLIGIVIIFQSCLIAGLPWGAASMGGKYPGKYPPKMRVVAFINILILSLIASIVAAKANLFLLEMAPFAQKAIWGVVAFFVLSTILNTITPSKIERIWAPVALIALITSIIVALG